MFTTVDIINQIHIHPSSSQPSLFPHAGLHQPPKHNLTHAANLTLQPRSTTILKLPHHARKNNLAHPRISFIEKIAHKTRLAPTGTSHTLRCTQHAQNLCVAINQNIAERGKRAEEVWVER